MKNSLFTDFSTSFSAAEFTFTTFAVREAMFGPNTQIPIRPLLGGHCPFDGRIGPGSVIQNEIIRIKCLYDDSNIRLP